MPNNVDSIIANEALQQTGAPPCSPRLFVEFFSTQATHYYKTPCFKDVSRPRPLHFLAPPLFFYYFYDQRFLTLRRCSYNINLCVKLIATVYTPK